MTYGSKQTAQHAPPEAMRIYLEEKLKALPCGSRALGYGKVDSDFDYYVQWGFGVETKLAAQGFEPVDSSYTDPTIVGVMRHRTDKIDVLLVEDLKIQKRILDLLKHSSPHLWVSKIPEGNMYDFWTVLVRLAMPEPDKK